MHSFAMASSRVAVVATRLTCAPAPKLTAWYIRFVPLLDEQSGGTQEIVCAQSLSSLSSAVRWINHQLILSGAAAELGYNTPL